FFSSRRRHTRCLSDWSSDVCSSDLKTSPTQRTLKLLRDEGFQVAPVERWKPAPRFNKETGKTELFPFGVRVDVYGFGDLLACKRSEERRVGKEGRYRMTVTR